MSLDSSRARLNQAAMSLRHTWQETRLGWRDQRALDFEQRYVVLVESCVRAALSGMARMDELLAQARRECE